MNRSRHWFELAHIAAESVGRRLRLALAVLLVAASVGCVGDASPDRPAATEPEGAGASSAAAREVVSLSSSGPQGIGTAEAIGGRAGEAAAATGRESTVEELLAEGLGRAGASPVHLAIRGTPAADSVRCGWRGVARTAKQREAAIRFLLGLDADDPIPSVAYLETFFAVALDTWNPEYRETSKAHFLGIARGGESTDYLFLTCFADYAVTNFLLGSGTTPTTVTVAYDRRAQARSYDLYVREHDSGTFGDAALAARGAYEASLQELVVAAEEELSAAIGGREAVVFLAPMGAHHAIGFEAWQAVAQWAVVTGDDGVVLAVRDDTPEGDPEHTQTLANLTSRITTAAAGDAHATTRVTTTGGLQTYYRTTLLAYADITPGDGQTTTFTPKQPPAAPTCTNGTVFANPAANRELVKDCEALLAAKDTLRGTATLNWSTGTAMSSWTGVTTGGTPTRVTGLSLPSKTLSGTIPPSIGHLFALTTLNLSSNSLTGAIPSELGWRC